MATQSLVNLKFGISLTRKTKPTKRPTSKLTRPRKSATKGAKAVKQALSKKHPAVKPADAKRNVDREMPPLDVSIFPPESFVVFVHGHSNLSTIG